MLRAQYLFRNKLVGSIVKSLAVAPADLAPSEATGPVCVGASVGLETSLANPVAIDPVDITLWVQKQHAGYVTWIARVSATGEIVGPFPQPLADTQRFAKALAGLRGTYGDTGNGARDELFVIGLSIAALIPAPIIERVLRPALAEGKPPPSIFLLTDEAYITLGAGTPFLHAKAAAPRRPSWANSRVSGVGGPAPPPAARRPRSTSSI